MKVLRRKQVEEITSLSRSTIYAMMADRLGKRAVGWSEAVIHEWLRNLSREG